MNSNDSQDTNKFMSTLAEGFDYLFDDIENTLVKENLTRPHNISKEGSFLFEKIGIIKSNFLPNGCYSFCLNVTHEEMEANKMATTETNLIVVKNNNH